MYAYTQANHALKKTQISIRERIYEYLQMLFLVVLIFSISNLILANWNEHTLSIPTYSYLQGTKRAIESLSIIFVSFSLLAIFLEIEITGFKFQVMHQICDEAGYHRLSKEEVLDNENRENIINAVYSEPGIHYNKLLRLCRLQPGQLQWHLKILLEYSIIEEQRWGRYVMFYLKQNLTTDQQERLRHPVLKSKTTKFVFTAIKNQPGIQPSEIAKLLELNRNTIKYHTDKLVKCGLIKSKKEGRSLHLFEISNTPYQC